MSYVSERGYGNLVNVSFKNLKFSFRARIDFENEKIRHGIHDLVDQLQLQTHHNLQRNSGIAGGAYDHNHKVLRQRWYQATTKLGV